MIKRRKPYKDISFLSQQFAYKIFAQQMGELAEGQILQRNQN